MRTQDDPETASRQSTVFLGRSATGTLTELAVDASQYLQNLVATTLLSEAAPASGRFNVGQERTVGCLLELDDADTAGALFLKNAGGDLIRLQIEPAEVVNATVNGSMVGSLTIPGLSGTPSTVIVAWASRANPLQTGASDAVQSWLYAANLTTGDMARVEFFHAVPVTASGTARWHVSLTGTMLGCWFERRCQSFTEVVRDWDASWSRSAPSSDVDVESRPLPLTQDTGIGDDDQLHGPVLQWAVAHQRHALRRHWTPLANIVYRTWRNIQIDSFPGEDIYRLIPGGSEDYYMSLPMLQAAPVPPGATHAWVRLHVRSRAFVGAAVPVGIAVVSMNRMPDEGAEPFEYYSIAELITRNDSASTGSWDLEGLVRLSVGQDGWTYLAPALAIDPADASANDANAIVSIHAFHAVPCFPTDGGAS